MQAAGFGIDRFEAGGDARQSAACIERFLGQFDREARGMGEALDAPGFAALLRDGLADPDATIRAQALAAIAGRAGAVRFSQDGTLDDTWRAERPLRSGSSTRSSRSSPIWSAPPRWRPSTREDRPPATATAPTRGRTQCAAW